MKTFNVGDQVGWGSSRLFWTAYVINTLGDQLQCRWGTAVYHPRKLDVWHVTPTFGGLFSHEPSIAEGQERVNAQFALAT